MPSKLVVLVTGASGFVGGHVARSFADAGHQVIAVNRSILPHYTRIQTLRCDLSISMPDVKRPVDVIVHCAALADYDAGYDQLHSANVIATQHIFQLAQHLKVKKFIHISSASVYREFEDKYRVDESFPLATARANHYAYTKKLAEEVIQQSVAFPVICLRPHIVYGPGDTTVLKDFLHRVRFNTAFLPIAQSKEISATYVQNLVAATSFFATRKTSANFHVFNIADREPIDCVTFIRKMMQLVDPSISVRCISPLVGQVIASITEKTAQLTNSKPLLTRDVLFQINHHSSLSQTRLSQTGFLHPFSVEEGLADVKRWFTVFKDKKDFLSRADQIWPGLF